MERGSGDGFRSGIRGIERTERQHYERASGIDKDIHQTGIPTFHEGLVEFVTQSEQNHHKYAEHASCKA